MAECLDNLIRYPNFLLKTYEGKSFLAEMILLQILCNILILSIVILNLKKKISDYLNFNSKILNFLGFRFLIPFSSYDQNGFILFRIILNAFLLVIFNQIIKARFESYIDKIKKKNESKNSSSNDDDNNKKNQATKEINKKSGFGFLLSFVSPILILSLSDITRDLATHFEYNIQNVLMNIPMTLRIFIIINALKFFMSGLKRLLKVFDSQFQNKSNQNKNKTNLKEKLAYFNSLFFITLIPNLLTFGFLIFIKDYSEKTYFNFSVNIGNINFTFLKNIKNGLISLILFKFIVDFIEKFIDFNNNPEKNYLSFFKGLNDGNKDRIKAFREIFIKRFKAPLNIKSFLFCLGKSILVSLILSLVFNINVSFENFFLKNQDQIHNMLNDYKFQIIFVLSFSIICGILCQIIKYESAFEKEKISDQEIDNMIRQENGKNFEIFDLSFGKIFSKT